MNIETIERIGRRAAAVVSVVVLILGVLTPTWWGLLGPLPLAVAISGW
jgi:hypothetical protein